MTLSSHRNAPIVRPTGVQDNASTLGDHVAMSGRSAMPSSVPQYNPPEPQMDKPIYLSDVIVKFTSSSGRTEIIYPLMAGAPSLENLGNTLSNPDGTNVGDCGAVFKIEVRYGPLSGPSLPVGKGVQIPEEGKGGRTILTRNGREFTVGEFMALDPLLERVSEEERKITFSVTFSGTIEADADFVVAWITVDNIELESGGKIVRPTGKTFRLQWGDPSATEVVCTQDIKEDRQYTSGGFTIIPFLLMIPEIKIKYKAHLEVEARVKVKREVGPRTLRPTLRGPKKPPWVERKGPPPEEWARRQIEAEEKMRKEFEQFRRSAEEAERTEPR